MDAFLVVVAMLVGIASFLYIVKRWRDAVDKRDAEWCLRPLAGAFDDERSKPSAFWYLFR